MGSGNIAPVKKILNKAKLKISLLYSINYAEYISSSIGRGKPLKQLRNGRCLLLNGPVRQSGNSHLFEFTQEINQGNPLPLRHVSIRTAKRCLEGTSDYEIVKINAHRNSSDRRT